MAKEITKAKRREWEIFSIKFNLSKEHMRKVVVLAPSKAIAELSVPNLADESLKFEKLSSLDAEFQKATTPKTPSGKEVAAFISKLNRGVARNYPVASAMKTALVGVKSPVLRGIVGQMRATLTEGNGTLADAMSMFPDVFEKSHVEMIRASEQTGMLTDMMGAISQAIIGKNRIRRKFIQQMTYPLLMLGGGTGVISLILFYVLPMAVEPKVKDGQYVNPFSLIPYECVVFIKENPYVLLIPIAFFMLLIFKWGAIASSEFLQRKIVKIPKIGDTYLAFSIVSPIRVMAMMQRAKIAAGNRIKAACEAAGNIAVREFFQEVGKHLERGRALDNAISMERWRIGEDVGDDLAAQATISQSAGGGDDILSEIADSMEDRAETTIVALATFLSPIITIGVAAMAFLAFGMVYGVQLQELWEILQQK